MSRRSKRCSSSSKAMWVATGATRYIRLLLVVLSWSVSCGSDSSKNSADVNYASMPQLHQYDDYGKCMKHASTYCVVRVLVKSNDSSALWEQIKSFSNDVRHYRHNLLDRGICIDECLSATSGLNGKQRDGLLVEPFNVDFNYRFKRKYFPLLRTHQELYGDVVNMCINQKLRSAYNLEAFSEIEYCQESTKQNSDTVDTLDGICIIIIVLIFCLAVISTAFDYYLKNKSDLENYFEIALPNIEYQIATVCSIPRNFKSLAASPKSDLSKDFKFLEGIRFITMTMIIHLHTMVMLMNVPTKNPELFEETLHNPAMAALSLFTPNLVQSFFTIGGILLTVNLLDSLTKNPNFRWKLIWDKVSNRLKRILPLYLFVILVTASIFRHIRLGPLFDRIVGVESENCRRNWWVNLLFLNNYVKVDETCVQPSWYLSADLQFYMFGMVSLMTMKRYPITFKYWIGFVIAFNLIGPGLELYARELPPLMATGTRPVLLLFTDDEWFARLYKPFHTSSAGYFYGVLAGLVYHHGKPCGDDLIKRNVFKAVKAVALMTVLLCYLPSYLVYEVDLKTLPWLSVYGSVAKNCWGFLCAVLLADLALSKKNRLRSLLEHSSLQPLGKLTYSVYHSHYLILMAIASGIRAPLTNDVFTPILFTAVALLLSYGLGLVVYLLVEQPAANLLTGKVNFIEYIGGLIARSARSCLKGVNKKCF